MSDKLYDEVDPANVALLLDDKINDRVREAMTEAFKNCIVVFRNDQAFRLMFMHAVKIALLEILIHTGVDGMTPEQRLKEDLNALLNRAYF